MKKIKIFFCDVWPEFPQENFILQTLKKHFSVNIDAISPDIVFHSIFGGMKESPKYKCKKVLFLGENYRPSRFNSDYSISFDPHSETNFRLPLWQIFILLKPIYLDMLFDRVKHVSFDRFCSFTVSNPNNFFRNAAFGSINSYKKVNSYGKYMINDMRLHELSQGKYWRDAKDEFFNSISHKFAITYENTSYPGYTTEKLMDAFLAGSMGIYWGNSRICDEFNEKAFINANKIHGIDMLEYIKKLDTDDIEFKKIYNEPVFTDIQKNKLIENLSGFEDWLIKIVNV